MATYKRSRDFWRAHFARLELYTAVLFAALFASWAEFCPRDSGFLSTLLSAERTDFHVAFASVVAALLGFTISATTLLIGFSSSPYLKVLRSSIFYNQIFEIYISSIRWLGLSTAWSLGAVLFDFQESPRRWTAYVTVFCICICTFRVYRTVWILEMIIRLVIKRAKQDDEQARVMSQAAQ